MRSATEAEAELARMPDHLKVEHLRRKLDAAYERESRHALAASSLDELVCYAIHELGNVSALNSCGTVARRSVARLALHLRRSIERIADGEQYQPPRIR